MWSILNLIFIFLKYELKYLTESVFNIPYGAIATL